MSRFKLIPKEKIKQLPSSPGVYSFKEEKEILYIGKAANIRNRVKNHFQQPNFRDDLFINKTKKIGFIIARTEIEALILEAKLIKKIKPKFNVLWKDDKNYFYVRITREDFPVVSLTHQTNSKDYHIGPFVDGKSLKETIRLLRKVLPYRSCRNLPKRPCLWYQLNRCPAPCTLKSKVATQIPDIEKKLKKEYRKNIKNLNDILKGRKEKVLKDLKKEMRTLSRKQAFEEAAELRNKIKALERVFAHKVIFTEEKSDWKELQKELKKLIGKKVSRIEAYDVSNFQGKEAVGSMVVFINGKPNKALYRKFRIRFSKKPNDTAMIREILKRRLNHPEWTFPEVLLIDGGKAQLNAALKEAKEKIKVLSLAKKKNELFIEGRKKPILLKEVKRDISDLMLQLRDEAHRFAITYHRNLRKKKLLD